MTKPKSEAWKQKKRDRDEENRKARASEEQRCEFHGVFGAEILNWDEVKIQAPSKRSSLCKPRLREKIRIRCASCGKEVVKVFTNKLMKSGVRHLCKQCAKPAVSEKMSKSHRKHRTPEEMRSFLDSMKRREKMPEESLETKEEIETLLNTKVLNWSHIQFTAGGRPKKGQTLCFICSRCQRQASQKFFLLKNVSPYCKSCMTELAYDRNGSWGSFRSSQEYEIHEFIESLGFQVEGNKRSVIGEGEVDLWIPEKGVAIEHNGLFWHSEIHKTNDYHVRKLESAREAGIRLIQIFEDEWRDKESIVRSRIESILGCSKRIYARKCRLVEVDNKTQRQFFESNHLQGSRNCDVAIGLEYDGKLMAVMSFASTHRRPGIGSEEHEWELLRFANRSGSTVVGGASRLMKWFRTRYRGSIISYAERRWSDGGLYESLGFEHRGCSKPSYWYVRGGKRYHRFGFAKHKLVEKGFDASKTEREIMAENGYLRVYDCGQMIYALP